MRRGIVALALLALFVLVPAPARAARATVTITDTAYSPSSVKIAPNDDVFWCPQNTTKTHNVNFGNKKSLDIPPGSGCTWLTFQDSGTFSYHCDFVSGMSGTVIVGSGTGGTTPASSTTRVTTSSTSTTVRRVLTTTTTATARHTSSTAATRSQSPGATSTEPSVTTPDVVEPVDDTTSTTAGQLAIKDASSRGGGGLGNALAIGAMAAMAAGGTAYVLLRRRRF